MITLATNLDIAGEPTGTATFSDDRTFRYTATRRWAAGPTLAWWMLNPSHTDHEKTDMTVQRVCHFSRAWGYGASLIVNTYPIISPDPRDIEKWLLTKYANLQLELNTKLVRNAILVHGITKVVVAFGNGVPPNQARMAAQAFFSGQAPLTYLCLGKTIHGAPTHPLARGKHRIPDTQQPIPFDMEAYCGFKDTH